MTKSVLQISRSLSRLCLTAALGGFMLFMAAPAFAGCAAGLPCITNATPNLPNKATDGPNAAGMPNVAKTSAGSGCDADFMNQIYSRAWMEGERDLIKAQIRIRKPDSVLEYTCFNQLAFTTGRDAGPLFTDSTNWHTQSVSINGKIAGSSIGNVKIDVYMGSKRLPTSINQLVLSTLSKYLTHATAGSFSHRFLGGSATALNYTAPGGGYDCSYMDQVHFLAKCADIVTDDRFWSLAELITPDPRLLPIQCTTGTKITQQRIDLANNLNFQYVNFDRVTPTYISLLQPPGGTPPACSGPIPTGVIIVDKNRSVGGEGTVTITATNPYRDMVCPNPNCSYCPSSTSCLLPGVACPAL